MQDSNDDVTDPAPNRPITGLLPELLNFDREIDDLRVQPKALDVADGVFEHLSGVPTVIADTRHTKHGRVPDVMVFDLRDCQIKAIS